MEKLMKKKLSAKQKGNMRQLAEVTNNLGDQYFLSGNLSKALEEYTEAVKAYEIFGVNLKCAVAYRRIGEINTDLGKYECAIKHLNLNLEEAKKLKNPVEEQRGFAALGRTYFLLAHTLPERSDKQAEALANARKFYNKSIILCDKLKGIPREELMIMRARLLLNQGLVQYAQMEPNEGINLIKSAIKILLANKLSDELHRAYLALGGLYEKQGNINLAVEILDLAAKTENKCMMADAILAKAELFLRHGEWMNARKVLVALYQDKSLSQSTRRQLEKFLRIAVTLCRGEEKLKCKDKKINNLKLYEDLGDAAVAAHCYNKAVEYYEEMLHHAESDKSNEKIAAALVSLAQTFKDAESAGSTSSKIIDMFKLALTKAEISRDPSLEVTVLKEYIHYLESQKSEIKTRLDLLSDRIPVLDSEKEIPYSQDVGADICLDDLSDMDHSDAEKNKDNPGTSMPRESSKFSIKRNCKGETMLHLACISGSYEKVQKLLEDGHPTNVRDYCGWTPLHEAANYGFLDIVRLLINAGAHVNDPGDSACEGVTPLHDAADGGNFSVMNLLIEKGADIHATTEKGNSILDSLEAWRKRAKNLSSEVELEYNYIYKKLSAKTVGRCKKNKMIDRVVASRNGKCYELIHLDED